MVTVRENRAQKAEGNPLHPINQGALCARGQASMQTLYNPNRTSKPSLRGKTISWEEGQKIFKDKLEDASGKVVYLGKPLSGFDKSFFEEFNLDENSNIIFSGFTSKANCYSSNLFQTYRI